MCGEAVSARAEDCPSCGEPLDEYEETSRSRRGDYDFEYANFGQRFGAVVIDFIIVRIIQAIFEGVLTLLILGEVDIFGQRPGPINDDDWLVIIIGGTFTILLYWLYMAGFESSAKQATPGKQICGIIVTDMEGNRISFLRATGRQAPEYLSLFTCFIGYFLAAFTDKEQALHDLIASTLVLRRD